jgi:hypothetical protein
MHVVKNGVTIRDVTFTIPVDPGETTPNGIIENVKIYSPIAPDDVNATFTLTAVGQQSGFVAQTAFTDARNLVLTFAGAGTGSVILTPSIGFISAPVSCGGTGANAPSQTVTSTCLPNITTTENSATITFSATPTGGSTFAGWSVASNLSSSNCTGTTNPCAAVLGSNPALTVTFNGLTATTTSVASNNNPSTYGQPVTFTATVSPSAATGTVNFKDGTSSIPGCSAQPLSSGQATCTTSALTVGSHSITAIYSGGGIYATSTSSTLTQNVNMASSTVTVTCTVGAPYTYSGSAQMPCTAEATGVGMSPVDVTSSLVYANNTNAGSATADANWAGDANHTGNTGSGGFTIGQASSTVTVTCPASATYTGLALTPCTANVTGTAGLNQSLPVSYINNTNPGTATASASYAGDANHSVSSGSKTFTIGFGVCSASVGSGGMILPPINSDGTSVYPRKGGSTVPVKFRVCDALGNSISNSSAVFAGTGGTLTMLSKVRATVDGVNEAGINDIPDVAFRWDASGKQWIYNMGTTNLTSGYTYTFRINLTSGNIVFVVGMK